MSLPLGDTCCEVRDTWTVKLGARASSALLGETLFMLILSLMQGSRDLSVEKFLFLEKGEEKMGEDKTQAS